MRVLLHKSAGAASPHDAQPVTPADVDPLEIRLDEVGDCDVLDTLLVCRCVVPDMFFFFKAVDKVVADQH